MSSDISDRQVAQEALFACRGLKKQFGTLTAVDGVGFEIAPGESYGLLGPNGAGKTTTISMLCGLLQPDQGEVVIAGRQLADDPTGAKAAIGLVPQEIALYPDLSAKENLYFFGRLYGLRGPDLKQRVAEVLELVGLEDRANGRIETFSGGMKRRINIAAGLLHRPSLLVLDEPTVGVDPQSRNAILERVAELRRSGVALLYTSHYMEEVERLCDRIGIMDAGRMIAEGTRRELVASVGQADRIELDIEGNAAVFAKACEKLPAVSQASAGEGQVTLLATGGRALLPTLLEQAEHSGVSMTGMQVIEPDLEAVFLHLTGKALRD